MALERDSVELRVLLVGGNEVGKTAIFNRFKTGQFVELDIDSCYDWSGHISHWKKRIAASDGREAMVSCQGERKRERPGYLAAPISKIIYFAPPASF
jgi:GTPase SAR1 family protein